MSSGKALNHGRKWVENGWAVEPSTYSAVLEAVSRVGALDSTQRYVWRGVSDFRFCIQPSAFRNVDLVLSDSHDAQRSEQELFVYERTLLEEARAWGLYRRDGSLTTDMDVLGRLQHNAVDGQPGTRLLDVTTDPFAALYFACEKDGTSGMIYAINVTGVSEQSTHPSDTDAKRGFSIGTQASRGRLERELSETHDNLTLLRPEFPDPRMAAQSGLFLFSKYPEDQTDLDRFGIYGIRLPTPVTVEASLLAWIRGDERRGRGRPSGVPIFGVVVSSGFKRKLRASLANNYRKEPATLFPDVSGFVKACSPDEAHR